jgi:hypothetical protein
VKSTALLKIPSGTQERESARIGKAHERLERAEKRMLRAFNAWATAREDLRRMSKRADKKLSAKMGGEYDPRVLANLDKLFDKDLDDSIPQF